MTIGELIDQLRELNRQLEGGNLSTEDIVKMSDLSRDLYERLVVIRHRSYEQLLAAEEETANEPEPDVEEEPANDESDEVRRPSIPVGKASVPPNQISLIDSIEEIKRMETSLNDKLKDEDRTTLGKQLKRQPIDDLPKAIGINQRFRFISELFQDDQAAFEDAIGRLNGFASFIEADEYVRNTLKERFDWKLKDPVVLEMLHLVERRYL